MIINKKLSKDELSQKYAELMKYSYNFEHLQNEKGSIISHGYEERSISSQPSLPKLNSLEQRSSIEGDETTNLVQTPTSDKDKTNSLQVKEYVMGVEPKIVS